jgi:hypothetical protein
MRFAPLLLAAAITGCAAPQPANAPMQAPRELAGRTAGAPERCVLVQQSESLRVSDNNRHVLLYGSGKTLWANELSPSCGFGANDILVSEPMGSYYCRGDLVRSIDRYSRIPGPACVIGEFVPYVRGG